MNIYLTHIFHNQLFGVYDKGRYQVWQNECPTENQIPYKKIKIKQMGFDVIFLGHIFSSCY